MWITSTYGNTLALIISDIPIFLFVVITKPNCISATDIELTLLLFFPQNHHNIERF